jgi:hypothetical protein
MGPRRPHHLALGLGVLAAALVAGVGLAGPSASEPGSRDVVRGQVEANVTTADGGEWTVRHATAGEYLIEFAGGDAELEIDRWDAMADATVIPMGNGADIVRFTNDIGPVDTSFSFTAIVGR